MNRTLLIIDDDRAIHDLVTAQLSDMQTQCLSAMSGAEGIRHAVEAKPRAILLDMDMPNMSGMEVCRRLKADPLTRRIPIMFLTSDRSTHSKVQGIDTGAIDYVTKPFDPFELRARIRSAFRSADATDVHHETPRIDEETGVWNRAFLVKQIEITVAAAARARQFVNCMFLSIDRFEELAEKTGQPGGGDLLRDAAEILAATVRLEDTVCRYDDRTLAVVGQVPDRRTGRFLAERVRQCVGDVGLHSFLEAEPITCSVGSSIARGEAGPMILRHAESALAEAQLTGNCVISAGAENTFEDATAWLQ